MWYKSKLTWLFVTVFIGLTLAHQLEKFLNPLVPAHLVFKVIYLVMFGFMLFFCIYDRIQIKRLYQNAKEEGEAAIGRKLLMDNAISLVACLVLIVYIAVKYFEAFTFFTYAAR